MRALPLVYALIIAVELVWLSWRYAVDPPSSSSELSIALGWGGLISMIVMLIYSVARRSRKLRQIARLSSWLHFHIFLGVQGVVFVVFHSMHLFTREAPINWLNPAVVNLIAVLIVFFSGIFGRWLYAHVPHAMGGEQIAAREVEAELAKIDKIPPEVDALWRGAKIEAGLVGLIRADIAMRGALSKLRGMSLTAEQRALAERRVRLGRRLAVLASAERLFRRWIVLHRPLASIMYVLSAVHVALSYMFTPSLGG